MNCKHEGLRGRDNECFDCGKRVTGNARDIAHAKLSRRYHFGCAEVARKLADEAERNGDHDSAAAFRCVERSQRKLAELCAKSE